MFVLGALAEEGSSETEANSRETLIIERRLDALYALDAAYAALGLDITTPLQVREFNAASTA